MKKLIFTVLFMGLISFVPSSLHLPITSTLSAQIPSDGLVAWYPFNGNANDESGNGNNGVVNGATLTSDRSLNSNSAFYFDGAVSRNILVDLLNPISGVKTFSLWCKLNSNFINPYCHLITCSGTGNDYLSINGNHPFYIANNTMGKFYDGKTGIGSSSFLNDEVWHQITVIHDFQNFQSVLYVDGQLVGSSSSNNFSNDPLVTQLAFGSVVNNVDWANTTLTGSLDDIAIYNRALSASEVTQLYQDQTGQLQQNTTCLPAYVPTDGLVGYWPFCGNANDESGNGNHGTVNGASLTSDRNGSSNSAYNFDGNDDIRVLSDNGLSLLTHELTISAWVNITNWDYSAGAPRFAIVDKYLQGCGSGTSQFFLTTAANSNEGYNFQSVDCGTAILNINAGEMPVLNQWTLVTVTCDGTMMRFYVNGTLKSSITQSSDLVQNFEHIVFGHLDFGNDSWAIGKIDDVAIYNRAITPQEIQTLVLSGQAPCTPVTNTIGATIIEGQSYTLGTQNLTTAGTYTEVFTSAAGCDSTVTLTLAVEYPINCNFNIAQSDTTVCLGSNIALSVIGNSGTQSSNGNRFFIRRISLNPSAYVSAGNWNYISITKDVNRLTKIYFNGQLVSSGTFANEGFSHSSLFIGASYYSGFGGFLKGWLDEVRISNRARTETEILTSYNQNMPFTQDPNTVALWRFNEVSGNSFNNEIGGSGSLFNGATFQNGRFGNAVYFDGVNDYGNCNFNMIENNYTIDAWVKLDGDVPLGSEMHYIQPYGLYNTETGFFGTSSSSIQYLWSNGATTSNITVSPMVSTTYYCTITGIDGVICTDSVHVIVSQPNSTVEEVSSCQPYEWNGNVYDQSGVYSWTGISSTGCDSIVTLNLTILPAVTNAISATITEGQSYTLGIQILTTAGTYTEVFTSAAGCDSTFTLTLAVEPLLTCEITAPSTTLCEGEPVTLSVNTTGGPGASSQLPANLQQGLVAYYPFNGNANDESGNGNDGVVNGATLTSDRLGLLNSAYYFNGTDSKIQFFNEFVLHQDSNASVSFWIYGEEILSNVYSTVFWSRLTNGDYNRYNLYLYPTLESSMNLILDYRTPLNIGNENLHIVNDYRPISYFNWNQISLVREGNLYRCYLNGFLAHESQDITPLLPIEIGWMLGVNPNGNHFFKGKLDEFMMYNRALSPSEIQQLYNAQSYAWSTGATTPTITVSPTEDTTYSCTVTQGNQTCTASVDITVNPAITNAVSATIIEGESYTLGTQTLTTSGTYTEVFTSAAGCDSTVTLTLAVEPLLTCNITAPTTTLCAGQSATLTMNTTVGAGASSQLPANLQQGLVAYYPFNGNANDESGNGNNGVVNGATLTSDRFGNEGGAYYFDGSASIKLPYSSNYQSHVGTISLWANVSDLPTNPSPQDLFFGQGWGFPQLVIRDNGRVKIQVANSVSDFPGVLSNTSLVLNDWMHIVAIYSDNYFAIYFNGVLNSEVTLSQSVNYFQYCQSEYWIGGFMHQNSCIPNELEQMIKAKIDNVVFYNRTLTDSEIQQLYTAQSYAWSNSATTPTNSVTPTQNTTYSCTVTQGNQTCTASVDITVNPNVTNAISASIIEGETYTFGAQTLSTAGTYTEVFTSAAGCDSTVTLTLSVEPLLTCNITTPSTSLCEGESVTLSVNTTGGAGASSQLPANLQQGLVAYYPFNGNANDESGNGNDGVVNGATLTADRFGNLNKAYLFATNQSMTASITNNAIFSISAWVRLFGYNECTNTSVIASTIVSHKNDGYYGNGFSIEQVNQQWSYLEYNGNSNYFQNYAGSVELGSWYHISYTSDAFGLRRMYINGVILDEYNYQQIIEGGYLLDFKIASSSDNPTLCYFNGVIDDVGYWHRALSPSEIQQLYTAESYAWSNNATTPTITVSPTANTTYSCTVTQGNQTCTASVDVTVNPNTTNAISASIIEGETYTLGSQTLTTGGTYTEVFTSAAGCDSTVTLTLSVEPLLTCEITAPSTTLCAGESVTLSVNTTGGAGASSQLPSNLQQGLVAYYPFNGNANDESGNGNDGVVNGATLVADRFANQDCSFNFSRESIQSINYGQNDVLNSIQELTIDFWTYLRSYGAPGESGYNHFVSKSDLANDHHFIIANNFNGLYFYFDGGNSFFQTDVLPELNVWTSIAVTYSYSPAGGNSWCRFYINGEEVAFFPTSQFLGVNSFPLKMGSLGTAIHDRMDGLLDDVAIYNRALSPSEIQQLYTAQSYAWSTGANTPTITVSPIQTTTYTATVTTATQTCTDSITITVNPLLTWYADVDADGFGNPDDVVQDCNQPQGYISDNTDCNDEDAATYPGAAEICDNNRDENCDGVDSLCFVPVLGCTDINACNFDTEANTEDGSCILPQPETCNGLDDNCNGQIDEGFSAAAINAVSAVTALYPVCSGNSIRSANLNNGANSAVIEGNGNDLWYSFTAQFNTFRAGLSAASGDNDVRLYTMTPGGCLELIETEHEITTGNQTLLSDQLTVGQTYYVAVHNISGPMNASAKICFNHLNASTCDHYYSNNTGIYTSVCNSFKAQYRANAVAYTFDILSATQNNVNQNITPWSYTTTSASTVVARLGTLLPANQGTSAIVYTLKVPVLYSLFDAAGNFENLFAQATTTCTVTLNAEQTVALRISDRCPTNKSLNSTIAPDRTVCGAMRYDWEFTQVLPNPGTAQVVQGGAYASAFFLSNVPGITAGKTYNVRVRPVHSSGIAGQWGAVQCLRVGSAGMVNHPGNQQSENGNESVLSNESRVTSISFYPNPTSTGSFVLEYNEARRGELIFAQESMTELVMMDITGKVVFKTNVVLNGNIAEIHFGDLESGLYLVDFGGERSRVQVMR